MTTAIKDITDVSTAYGRIYDIADRLFKKYNPCNIYVKNNKTKCINKACKYNYLCCKFYDDRCKHWKNGCTVKCLACKLFVCGQLLYEYDKNGIRKENKKYIGFTRKLRRLKEIARKHRLSGLDYYCTKKEALQRIR